MKRRIVIVDRSPLARYAYAKLLEEAPGFTVAGASPEWSAARKAIDHGKADGLIMESAIVRQEANDVYGTCRKRGAALFIVMNGDLREQAASLIRGERIGLMSRYEEPEVLLEGLTAACREKAVWLSPAVADGVAAVNGELGTLRLTPREHQLLALLLSGASNRTIAERLHLSLGTVKNYLCRLYEKLDVHTRAEALARYLGDERDAM
jgi:DNA-binding NarL/FixJ family response regulator